MGSQLIVLLGPAASRLQCIEGIFAGSAKVAGGAAIVMSVDTPAV